jgi:NTP pyrophosphatase (non-canonical NTP hydrolase)
MSMKQLVEKLASYSELVARSDKLPAADLEPALLGLLGEVGGVLTTAKKVVRERSAYQAFRQDAEEELGDTLWYLAAICRRAGVSLPSIFEGADINHPAVAASRTRALFDLFDSAASLSHASQSSDFEAKLRCFAHCLSAACTSAQVDLGSALQRNADKVSSRFLPADFSRLPTFDSEFSTDEQLPERFEFFITQRKNGQAYISLNGVFVGDPLGDNMENGDGYRFHDVFHMANAAILHWSPVLRALLKRKRKSCKKTDATEDSGRAIVVEEGLSAWLFARAKEHKMFEGASGVSFDILKRVGEFVQGYEVARCPLVMWERAILQGYDVFRKLAEAQTGIVCGDRRMRTISFKPLP